MPIWLKNILKGLNHISDISVLAQKEKTYNFLYGLKTI